MIFSKRSCKLLLAGSIAVCGTFITSDYMLNAVSEGKVFNNLSALPHNKVGVIPGCSKFARGKNLNHYFLNRIIAAVKVFKAGKVEYLIVSGDNSRHSYNEPEMMKEALVKRGIPEEKIFCDYAGLRTLDTVVRAKEIFQQESFTFISQEFQNKRAIFLGDGNDIHIYGYNASDVNFRYSIKTKVREQLSKVMAVLDVHVFRTSPKFLGEKIDII